MRHFRVGLISLLALVLCLGFFETLQAQTLFQNNNTSCEDDVVVGAFNFFPPAPGALPLYSQGLTCGRYNDDTASGNPDFPDCATQRDPVPAITPTPNALPSNSILFNTAAHGDNCVNAGEPNAQFQTAVDLNNRNLNLTMDPDEVPRMGSIRSGNLNGADFDDLAWVYVQNPALPDNNLTDRSIEFLFNMSGSFGSGDFTPSGAAILGEPDASDRPRPYPLDVLTSLVAPPDGNVNADRSLLLFDCNGDGLDDGIVSATQLNAPFIGFMVAENNGAGLSNPSEGSDFYAVPIDEGTNRGISLTHGDFNNDNIPDIMAAVNTNSTSDPDSVVFCAGDGACGFECPTMPTDPEVFDLNAKCGGVLACDPLPTSIIDGDFNGDGLQDVAVVESFFTTNGAQGDVFYLFNTNNGGQVEGWSTTQVTVPQIANTLNATAPLVITSGRFTTSAIQDNVDEVAVTVNQGPSIDTSADSRVNVITSDGFGGLNSPINLEFSLNMPRGAAGIEATDFDHCGGDDILALVFDFTFALPVVDPRASLFLNTNEPPVITVDSSFEAEVNTTIPIPATCTDPTDDDRNFTWAPVSAPAGGNSIIGVTAGDLVDPDDDASTTFLGTSPGTYVIQITCTDFCGLSVDAQVTIEVLDLFTQGACIASLNPNLRGTGNGLTWFLLLMVPALLLLKRIGRRALMVSVLALGFVLAGAPSAQALTQSFQVEFFEPTVDDSNFFSVYGAKNMLKRNYHVGIYFDYAHTPYEFGDVNFNRVSGIVDHLITANIVGSYAVLDRLSIGAVIPVFIYESLQSPLLGLSEGNFALGDTKLVFKLMILDPEKHGIGIATVPFASFPSSTNSGDFLGNGGFMGGSHIVIDGAIGERVSVALNVGFLFRGSFTDVGGNQLGSGMSFSLGVSGEVIKEVLRVIAEAQVATPYNNFFGSRRTTPAEARLGFRYTFAKNHDINAGGGVGLSNGISQPDFRALLGYTYTKRPLADVVVPPPPMSEIQVGDELTLKDKIYFEFDKAKIRDISKPTLDKIAGFLKAHPEITKIQIDGFTCDLGTDSYNLRLSQRRARSVAQYLEGQGISPDRIGTVKGYGEANPLVPNTDEANREQNRRVQIFVEAVDHSLVQPAPAANGE